jgi:hypothetical protein
MQILGLHRNIYKAACLALSTEIHDSQVAYRQKILGDWELLKSKGLKDSEIRRFKGSQEFQDPPIIGSAKGLNFWVLKDCKTFQNVPEAFEKAT